MAENYYMAEIEMLRRQIRYLLLEMERKGHYGIPYPNDVAEAHQYGVHFPTARGREFDDDIIYWETVDKARLPEHLLNRFHILFCMSELQREKACLKSLLAEERRRQMLAELSDVLGLNKAQRWLRSKVLRRQRQEVATNPLEARVPPPHARAESQSQDRQSDLECPICMDADVEVQVQDCRHKMCTSCATAMFRLPHPHCPFCRGRNYKFVPILHRTLS